MQTHATEMLETLTHLFRPSVPKLGYAYPQGYAKWFRGENFRDNRKRTEIRRMYRLKQNCNFQTETSFCASKSPKFPCILSCEAVFLSYKHNNDRNDEQALIRKQNHRENVTSVLNWGGFTQLEIKYLKGYGTVKSLGTTALSC